MELYSAYVFALMFALALFIVCVLILLHRSSRPAKLNATDREIAVQAARPLVARLDRSWVTENAASWKVPAYWVALFWAEQLAWVERRHTRRGWEIRLTRRGAARG